MYELLDQQAFAEMVMILRKLWLKRNALIFDHSFIHPTNLVCQAREHLQEYQKLKWRKYPIAAIDKLHSMVGYHLTEYGLRQIGM